MSQNLSEREKMFKEAKEKVAKEQEEALKKKANSSNSFTREYDDLYYTGLEYGKDTIFRLWGDPLHSDNKSNESPHKVFRARIIDDNDKICYINFPDKTVDPNWILHRVMKKVLEVKWDNTNKDKDGKGTKIFVNEKLHPSIFNRVNKNNRIDIKAERGWNPTASIVMQGIDRQMMDWHREKKSFRLLSKKIGKSEGKDEKGNKIVFEYPEYGVPNSLYTEIWNKVVEYYNQWEGYDLLLRKKIIVNNGVEDYIYESLNASQEINKVPEALRKFVSQENNFTEEELSWKRYDIARLCKVSSYSKILKHLGIFIQQVDKALNTKFYDELIDLATKEKEEFQKTNNSNSNDLSKSESIPEKSIETKVETTQQVLRSVKSSQPVEKPVEEKFDLSKYYDTFPQLKDLTDDERNQIVGWDGKDFIYKSKNLLECPVETCKYKQPVEIASCCLGCGIKFE